MSTDTNAMNIQKLLNGAISSLTNIIPLKFDVLSPALTSEPYEQKEISVLINIVGAFKGRLIIDTSLEVIDAIGLSMFGMNIEGEMVESFTGELGNMVAGNLCTVLEKDQFNLDISTPTVMTGTTKFYGFKQAFKLPVRFESGAMLHILLTIDDQK